MSEATINPVKPAALGAVAAGIAVALAAAASAAVAAPT